MFGHHYNADLSEQRVSECKAVEEALKPEKKYIKSLDIPKYFYLIPVGLTLAASMFFLPYAPLVLKLTLAEIACTILILSVISGLSLLLGIQLEGENGLYDDEINRAGLGSFLLYGAFFGPIIEEVMFRGIMQPLLLLCFLGAGMGFVLSPALAIGITAITFGLIHLGNTEDWSNYGQAIYCIFGGLFDGCLALAFGLPASILSHMVHNTFFLTLCLSSLEEAQVEEDEADFFVPAPACG